MSIHINDTLFNIGLNNALVVSTNTANNMVSSIDLLNNLGSSSSDQSLVFSTNIVSESSSEITTDSASTITNSIVSNNDLLRIIDNELYTADRKRGGDSGTFVKYTDDGLSLIHI